MFWTWAARPVAAVRLSFTASVMRPAPFTRWHFRMTARRCFLTDWERVEVSARLNDNLLAEVGLQISRLNFLYSAVVKVAQLEWTECDADQPIHS
jgi:hypothetical protein